ncbi:hypothetical protein ACIBL8_37495 [Streptomyces sp. NPDC050523]|uniref:hypothetical protein n=1 Tax=Streptomyces sp. NPDC050523 TaxID=3365622 RepID=UPI0037B9B30C
MRDRVGSAVEERLSQLVDVGAAAAELRPRDVPLSVRRDRGELLGHGGVLVEVLEDLHDAAYRRDRRPCRIGNPTSMSFKAFAQDLPKSRITCCWGTQAPAASHGVIARAPVSVFANCTGPHVALSPPARLHA